MKRNNWRGEDQGRSTSPRGSRKQKWTPNQRYETEGHRHSSVAGTSSTDSRCFSSTSSQTLPTVGLTRNNPKEQEHSRRNNCRQSQSSSEGRRQKNWPTSKSKFESSSSLAATSSTEPSASSSSSSSASHKSAAPELPGFYFDPEKNRYFRLLPGHNNCNPLTKESIKHKEMESKRLKLLEEDKHRKKTVRSGMNSSLLLQKAKLGLLGSTSYCRLLHQLKVSCMQKKKLEVQSMDSLFSGAGDFKLIAADRACEQIFTVNEAEQGGCKYGILNLKPLCKDSLQVEMHENLYFTNRKVSAACWASLTHPDSHLLLCFMGNTETPGSVSVLPASLFMNSSPGDQPGMLCNVRITDAWSCAWCPTSHAENCFSTGLARRVLLTNLDTGQRRTFGAKSDVLVQQFATQTPVLYNGCRSGEVFSIDIRQNIREGQSCRGIRFYQDSALTSLQLLEDENYMMASDMSGKIRMWDLRTMKCVKQYEGNHNEYASLPLHVCEEKGLLLTVGQDCYTRIWSLQDTYLIRTIPSPYPISNSTIPTVVFSSQLGGRQGVPGLLMAVKQDLYHFSYNTDNCC
ncbi:hypothetical protein NDU88_000979 [Pleurodeles waltl]|uniref:DDB1- and CUL4-associated factor 4 n=1 Tax=Pleurodeles waltl TaxID=8319 RepID=A0AAV7MRG1_PLEWA|nr:hypothetical protein NDU88_000979 [Pleurodeles waltl]